MQNLFKGGVSKVEFSTDDFGTVAVEVTEFTKSGNTWPEPEPVKDAIHDDQEVIAAWDVPFAFGGLDVPVADADTIAAAGEAGTRYSVRFTSLDGKFVMTLKDVIPQAWPVGITERGTHGYVRFEGKATGISKADAYTAVHTP